MEVLNGIKHRATYGYYVTRLMSPKERDAGMSWAKSREAERQCFEQNMWRQVREQGRLGTENLSIALSCQLTRMIAERYDPPLSFILR